MYDYSLPPRSRLSGDDLRLLRLVRRVTATEMAPHYGASRAAICNIERAIRPQPATVTRYMRALTEALAARDRDS